MKLTLRSLCLLSAATLLACTASALTITPTSGTLNVTRWEGTQTSQSQIEATIAPIIAPSILQFKVEPPSTESGPLAGSYSGTAGANNAVITYVSGTSVGPTAYLLVKDGNHDPAWYLFNLTALGWNGTDTLNVNNFWMDQGSISHVSVYGTTNGTSVPDGGATLSLLGLGLLGLALLRRLVHA